LVDGGGGGDSAEAGVGKNRNMSMLRSEYSFTGGLSLSTRCTNRRNELIAGRLI
jgi:hypothetical protein